jgi:CheY-like chemotaxis protein
MAKSLSILVVDDDRDNADSLTELFAMEGHRVTVAYSGEEAVAAYVNTAYDIAFMDVMMPGRNGVESFLEIRKLRPDAKVFMMTGYSVEQLLHQAMQHGAMGVLTKPIDLGKLLKMLGEVTPDGIVVVTDDGSQLGGQIKSLINGAGMSCDLLHNSEDATGSRADVMIIDLGLPLINGVEVYTRLKRNGLARPAIIVAKSSTVNANSTDALRDVAVTGILNKPFDPVALLDRLNHLAA